MTLIIDAAFALLPDGWARDVRLETEGGWITHVETDVAGMDPPPVALVPGMVNAHATTPTRVMAGLAERHSGDEGDEAWRTAFANRLGNATPETIGAVAAFAYGEMLEGGFTGAAEFIRLHNAPSGTAYDDVGEIVSRFAEAGDTAGLPLLLLPSARAFGGPGEPRSAPHERREMIGPERFARLVARTEEIASGREGLRAGMGLLAPWALPVEAVRELTAGKRPVQAIVGERNREALAVMSWAGRRAVAWLDDTFGLDPNWSLVHGNHLVDEEARRLAGSGGVLVACPSHGLASGAGAPPLPRYTQHNGQLAIGTASVPRGDVGAELRALEHGQRPRDRARSLAWRHSSGGSLGRTLFDACRTGGAQVLGLRTGRLDLGYRADIVALDTALPDLADRAGDALLDGWLFGAGREAVRSVWCGGVLKVENGRHVDAETLKRNYVTALRRLAAS